MNYNNRRGIFDPLGSKTLGTKCIRISLCIMLANHYQNIETRFRLAQNVFMCKVGIE